jgi:modulator of FtsH protease HflK
LSLAAIASLLPLATGQVARFNKIYEQYKKAPDVTRECLYLETMERVLAPANKIIIDQSTGQGQGVIPYLPLGALGTAEGGRK